MREMKLYESKKFLFNAGYSVIYAKKLAQQNGKGYIVIEHNRGSTVNIFGEQVPPYGFLCDRHLERIDDVLRNAGYMGYGPAGVDFMLKRIALKNVVDDDFDEVLVRIKRLHSDYNKKINS